MEASDTEDNGSTRKSSYFRSRERGSESERYAGRSDVRKNLKNPAEMEELEACTLFSGDVFNNSGEDAGANHNG